MPELDDPRHPWAVHSQKLVHHSHTCPVAAELGTAVGGLALMGYCRARSTASIDDAEVLAKDI
jgi:hypothetical protein